MKGLDLSKMKKVDANRDHTVFQHPEGHLVYVKNSALRKEVHDSLRKLPLQKMSKGGMVRRPDISPTQVPGTPEEKKKIEESFKKALGFQRMSDGGLVKYNQGGTIQKPVEQMTEEEQLAALRAMRPPTPPEEMAAMDAALENINTPSVVPSGPVGSKVQQAALGDLTQVTTPESEIPSPAIKLRSAEEQAAPSNYRLLTPTADNEQGLSEQPLQSSAVKSLEEYEKAALAEAKAQATVANEQAQVLQNQINHAQTLQGLYQDNIAAMNKANEQFQQDLLTQKINPNQFMESKTTLGKILTGIGLAMGGAPAIQFIQKQIENDIEAQRAAINNKQTLYAKNMELYGNVKDALDATRIQMNSMVEAQLKQKALQGAAPQQLAAAQKAVAELKLGQSQLIDSFSSRQAQQQLLRQVSKQGLQSGAGGTERLGQIIQMIPDTEDRKKATEELELVKGADAAARGIRQAFDEIRSVGSIRSSIPYSESRKTLKTANAKIISAIRAGMKGQGALSDQEIKDTVIPLLGSAWDSKANLYIAEKAVLDTIYNKRDQNLGTLSKLGIAPPPRPRSGPKPKGIK